MNSRIGLLISATILFVGCDAPVPVNPGYAADVRPIFVARCVRCHGANGTLNVDPDDPERGAPKIVYLNQYDTVGGHVGAGTFAAQIPLYIHSDDESKRMPPPPSSRLSDWELAVIDAWAATTPPKP
jgi:hypothetical protein